MERIKKAFVDASKKRGDASAETMSMGQASEINPHYSQTRVVAPNLAILKQNRIITSEQQNKYTDIYRMLRTKVLKKMRENNWNTLGITSPSSGEGKSVTSINLAISIAKEHNQTVLLVDFDLRRPSIHHYYGLENMPGISDHLNHHIPIEEILICPGVERLVILPGREPVLDSSEALSSPKFVTLIEEIKTRYTNRIVLFDLPPLLLLDDVIILAPYIDAFLLVIEEGVTDRNQLMNSKRMLENMNVIGTVLNKGQINTKDHYYV